MPNTGRSALDSVCRGWRANARAFLRSPDSVFWRRVLVGYLAVRWPHLVDERTPLRWLQAPMACSTRQQWELGCVGLSHAEPPATKELGLAEQLAGIFALFCNAGGEGAPRYMG